VIWARRSANAKSTSLQDQGEEGVTFLYSPALDSDGFLEKRLH
jgi:hypothetical protein